MIAAHQKVWIWIYMTRSDYKTLRLNKMKTKIRIKLSIKKSIKQRLMEIIVVMISKMNFNKLNRNWWKWWQILEGRFKIIIEIENNKKIYKKIKTLLIKISYKKKIQMKNLVKMTNQIRLLNKIKKIS
jgi:hypothetical protein